MKISFDGTIMAIQPGQVSWEPPEIVARDGNYAPIRSSYWGCRLSMGLNFEPVVQDWAALPTMATHTVALPAPSDGRLTTYTCYVDSVTPNFDVRNDCAVLTGFDVALAGIVV